MITLCIMTIIEVIMKLMLDSINFLNKRIIYETNNLRIKINLKQILTIN